MQRLIISVLFTILLSSCIASPRSLQSEGIIVETATLVVNQEGAKYLLIATFENTIPENTHAMIIYQDLSDPDRQQELDLGTMSDARKLSFSSRPTKAITKQDYFDIELLLFKDESKGRLLARRSLSLPLDVSDRVAAILGITWL